MQRRNRTSNYFYLLIAALCILGQVSSFAHLLLVRHIACATHQNLLEETDEHQTSAAPATDQNTISEQTDNPQHDHQDCLLCAQKQKLAAVPKVNIVALLLISCLAPRAPSQPVLLSSQAIYSLAPKTSPPLV
jgi:hypothetical protein